MFSTGVKVLLPLAGGSFHLMKNDFLKQTTKEKIAIIEITMEVENLKELNKVIKLIRQVESVYEVKRKKV